MFFYTIKEIIQFLGPICHSASAFDLDKSTFLLFGLLLTANSLPNNKFFRLVQIESICRQQQQQKN